MPLIINDSHLTQLSELIADKIGLYFPHERWADLKRGLIAASHEFGFKNPEECAHWLLSSAPEKSHLQLLANHLTIGETYFFRDKQLLKALTENILPALISSQRNSEKCLRFWCAGCCSGEEAYTLAVLLHQLLPDLQDWQVIITATDINLRFLDKAAKGIYSEWSFRDSPNWLKNRYFKQRADGNFSIVPEIKKMVSFGHLNLVEDVYPSTGNNTNLIDLIFCRNVLMYFSPAQAQKVISNLSKSLIDNGWLLVSPSEASKALFPQFVHVNYPGAILFQKGHRPVLNHSNSVNAVSAATLVAPITKGYFPLKSLKPPVLGTSTRILAKTKGSSERLALAQSLYTQGSYSELADMFIGIMNDNASKQSHNLETLSLLALALANLGRLKDALVCCNSWIRTDKLDATAYYIRALILTESGEIKQACSSLKQAIFLRPNFALAYFSLGSIEHNKGKMDEAYKHFSIVKRMLSKYQIDDILPESDNLTVGQLNEIINAMPIMEAAS